MVMKKNNEDVVETDTIGIRTFQMAHKATGELLAQFQIRDGAAKDDLAAAALWLIEIAETLMTGKSPWRNDLDVEGVYMEPKEKNVVN